MDPPEAHHNWEQSGQLSDRLLDFGQFAPRRGAMGRAAPPSLAARAQRIADGTRQLT